MLRNIASDQFECLLVYLLSGTFMQYRNLLRTNNLHKQWPQIGTFRPCPQLSRHGNIFVDFWLLVLPMMLVQTLLADHLFLAFILLGPMLLLLGFCARKRTKSANSNCLVDAEHESLRNAQAMFKAIFLICTGFSIIAADFSAFSRRFRKSHSHGFTVMDSGTAAFVFVNALGDQRAECLREESPRQRARTSVTIFGRSISILFILFILGIARYAFLTLFQYGYDEDEYGVHWNFFFTLFFLRAFVALMPSRMLLPIGLCIGLAYEFVLKFLGSEQWMLQKMPRNGANWLVQNREGFFSMFGYCFIYALSLAYARWHYRMMKMGKRCNISAGFVFAASCLFWQIMFYAMFGMKPSRRVANLSYSLGSLALFSASISGLRFIQELVSMPAPAEDCLVHALGRNGLLHFFVANLLTALINLILPMARIKGMVPLEMLILSAHGFLAYLAVLWASAGKREKCDKHLSNGQLAHNKMASHVKKIWIWPGDNQLLHI